VNPIALLRKVDFKNILKVIFIGLKYPLFIIPTVKATRKCIAQATKHYGKLHHKNGPANAFRHAYWNYLIAKKCSPWTRNRNRALLWAKEITDWHEGAFPNDKLAKKMDFHNNAVGRFIFEQHHDMPEDKVLEVFKNMTMTSVKIHEKTDLSNYKNQLAHILD
jgi:hypothetical protein